MKNVFFVSILLIGIMILPACGGRYHSTDMPDPEAYNAHFGDMDASGDEVVTWSEFKEFFPGTGPEVFGAVDLNADGEIDHDEWHEFKDAHGMRDEGHS
jgi:hypothetical protein